jgi:hypothetical protein
MLVTLAVLKCPSGLLKIEAPSNIRAKDVAFAVFHPVKGWLNLAWFRKTPANDATRRTHQFPITPP